MSGTKLKEKLTPSFIRKYKRKLRDQRVAEEFSGLSNEEVFEKIYEEKRWGLPDDVDRKYSSGDGTRDKEIVLEYVAAVKNFFLNTTI